MKEMLGTLAAWIIPLLFGIVWVLYVVRIVKNIYMPVKKVKAVLVEKYSYTPVSKNTAAFNTDSYVLVFEAEGEKTQLSCFGVFLRRVQG